MTTKEAIAASGAFMTAAERLPTLYRLEEELLQLTGALDTPDEERTDEQRGLVAALETMLAAKLENYCQVVETFEQFRDSRKAAADRLRARAASHDKTVDRLKERLLQHMQMTGQQRIETVEHTISIRQNPERVEVLEELLIPKEFKRTVVTTTIDKIAIKKHLHATGEVIPGVAIVRDERVSIS